MAHRAHHARFWLIIYMIIGFSCGCSPSAPPEFSRNQVEWIKQEKIHLGPEEGFSESLRSEVDDMMKVMFGTPDHVRIPPSIQTSVTTGQPFVKLEHLKLAAGAVASDDKGVAQGLYREHCAHCHGITGDGRGPGATVLLPHPRDYRLGKFKFKSTPQRHPPTDEDLRKILVKGIPGTAMPSFHLLEDGEITALVDYVKYLAVRGQVERYLLNEVGHLPADSFFSNSASRSRLLADNLPDQPITSELGQRLSTAETSPGELWRYLEENYEETFGETFREFVRDRWANINEAEIGHPQPPQWLANRDALHSKKMKQGVRLFLGKGTCHQCHGKDGTGYGELAGYDAWTDDWIKSPGVDIDNQTTLDQFIGAGANQPRLARPRNLNQAIYRGGNEPESIYLRIANGIEGSPMPAATALSPDEIWCLVALVLELPRNPKLLQELTTGGKP